MVVEQIPGSIGLVYALVLSVAIAYLWHSGQWRQKVGLLLLAVTAVLGFLAFSPVMPGGFQQLVLRGAAGLGAPLAAGGLTILSLLTLVAGRSFCGYLCPVGAVQEIAHDAPVSKTVPRQKTACALVRGAFFVVFLVMAFVFSISLLAWFGVRDFFYLLRTAGTLAFIVLLLVSTTLYRLVLPPRLPVRPPALACGAEERPPAATDRGVYRVQGMRTGLPDRRGEPWRREVRVLPLRAGHGRLPRSRGAAVSPARR